MQVLMCVDLTTGTSLYIVLLSWLLYVCQGGLTTNYLHAATTHDWVRLSFVYMRAKIGGRFLCVAYLCVVMLVTTTNRDFYADQVGLWSVYILHACMRLDQLTLLDLGKAFKQHCPLQLAFKNLGLWHVDHDERTNEAGPWLLCGMYTFDLGIRDRRPVTCLASASYDWVIKVIAVFTAGRVRIFGRPTHFDKMKSIM
jgi:hypothetical protein